MAAKEQWSWRNKIVVPDILLQGDLFDRYDDESNSLDLGCPVRVDEYGFFLVWEPRGKEAGILDLTQLWEARPIGTIGIRDAKLTSFLADLEQRSKPTTSAAQQSGPGESLEDRTIWLTYGQDLVLTNGLYLVATSAQLAKEWRSAINEFLRTYKIRFACPMHCLQKHWRYICLATNERGRIPLRNLVRTFASGKPEKMVHKCLADLGLSGDKEREDLEPGLFTFDKFLRLYHKICPRTDIQELFVRLSGQKEYLTRDRLITFLNDEQRDPRLNEILFPHFDQDRVQQILAKYESDDTYIAQGKMSGDAFLRFLLSDDNSPVFLDRTDMYQDMDQPLCHYFINSSHNTYLTGRQYGGKSSTEVYRQVLLAGCRCIELDCWDGTGENKGEPIITHGKAMCTDVFFKEVLYQIRETAFLRSDFPVFLSFENHCSKSNQLKMAKYCLEIFGDMLLSKPLDDHPLEPGVPLPSPNRLRKKILIKNKRLKKEEERRQMEQFLSQGRLLDEEEEQPDQQPGEQQQQQNQPQQRVVEHPTQVAGETEAAPAAEQSGGGGGQQQQQKQQQQQTLSPPPTSDQRAHPEEELGGSGSQHPLGKPRLGPTVSSASLCAAPPGETPAGQIHRSSLSNTPSRQNSTMALAAAMSSPQTLTAMASTGELSKEAADEAQQPKGQQQQQQGIISKLRQPLGLNRKVQPALTKEEEERLFKLIQETYHYQGATTNIHPLLSSLINYTHPVKFSGFDVAEQNDLHFHMSSFSESTGLGLLKQSAPEWVNYNKRQLSRIYPKGARVDSSNFLPQIFWNAGCQMVALNFQTPDVCMQLNQGKFEYNGQSGYLLKPDFMRRPDRSFDPFSESPVDGVIAAHCSVRIISGQFLCERKVGTYVEVEMYGLPTDTIRKEHRTKLVPGNGLNPVYNEEPFVFRKVILPELAVLRFAVYDESGKQLGQRILPLDGLQSGYRHISLRTDNNMPLALPTLFVHLQLKTYVPDELSGLVDALADPRAYLSAQDKREEALQQMFVDDLDDLMSTLPAELIQAQRAKGPGIGLFDGNSSIRRPLGQQNGGGSGGGGGGGAGCPQSGPNQPMDGRTSASQSPCPGAKEQQQQIGTSPRTVTTMADGHSTATVDGKFQVELIDIGELRKEKVFTKLQKRAQKERDELCRRHQKLRESVQKSQQSSVEKLVAGQQLGSGGTNKLSLKRRNHLNNISSDVPTAEKSAASKEAAKTRHFSLGNRISDPAQNGDQQIRSLVQNQTDEWSTLLRRLELEQFEQRKHHIRDEYELLRRLLVDRQKQQLVALRARFELENKELKQAQTKKSMEDSRALHQDKAIKTKAERDRRIKELNEKNVKLFVEERKRLATRSRRHEEQLNKRHNEQLEALDKESARNLELEENGHRECLLASQPQCVV